MTDLEAIDYLKELMLYNNNGEMITPKNKELGYDTFYQYAFQHAKGKGKFSIKALEERYKQV